LEGVLAPRILALLLIVSAVAYMDRQILAILIEPIKHELNLSDTQAGLLYGFTFAAFFALLGVPIAKRTHRTNRSRIIVRSLALFSTMTLLCGFAGSYWQLLAARVGVGIGEAGTSPASQSMIADLYPLQRRSGAMAIFATGPHVGIVLGFLIGGLLASLVGWREAFVVAGCLSLAVTVLVRVSLREPAQPAQTSIGITPAVSVRSVAAALWQHVSVRHIFAGATIGNIATAAVTGWLASFLVRSHGFSVGAAGTLLALAVGVLGGAGVVIGGWLADRMGTRAARWRLQIPASGILIGVPCWGIVFADIGMPATLVALMIGAALLTFHTGPTFAIVQSAVPPPMRALAAALLLLATSLVGFALGPLLIGRLSDVLAARYGADSLRVALLIVPVFYAWAASHYYMAARTLDSDLDAISGEMLTQRG
jgi:predicted MFS family arabinose efflux permease